MYVRTPKRYTRQGRKRSPLSLRWLWLWILTPLVVVAGIGIYQNQGIFRERIGGVVDTVVDSAGDRIATINAPTPVPTQDPTENIARANASWERGAIQEAVEAYAEIIDAVPNDLNAHYHYTLGLIMEDKDVEALEAAENTVTANPFVADAWAIRAMALSRTGNYGQAVASALHALELAPQDAAQDNLAVAKSRARALAFLAEAYFYDDQYERAASTVQEALNLDPDCFEAYYVSGLVNWFYNIDRQAAMQDFDTAYGTMPNMIYIGIEMSYLESEIQVASEAPDFTQAEGRIEGILELNPDNARALYWMGDYYFRTVGDPNRSADYLSRCTNANPNNPSCHYLLGRARMRQELYSDALLSFETAIDLSVSGDQLFARYNYWAAEASRQLNDLSGCLTYLQTAIETAQVLEDQVVLDAYPTLAQQCGGVVIQPTPTPEATAEGEGSG